MKLLKLYLILKWKKNIALDYEKNQTGARGEPFVHNNNNISKQH